MDFSSIVGAVTGAVEGGSGSIFNQLTVKVAGMAQVDHAMVENLVTSAQGMLARGTAMEEIKTRFAPMVGAQWIH